MSTMRHIPFLSQWNLQMVDGRKTATSRTKRYGDPGDTFSVYGHYFVLTLVRRHSLGCIAQARYKQEGCESPEAFREVWRSIHPHVGFRKGQIVWYHEFRLRSQHP